MDLKNRNSLLWEIIRFVVIGVYATILDYVIEVWLTSLLQGWVSANAENHIAAFFILFLISVLGLVISTPASWALTSVWGFQNVSEESEKEAKSIKGTLKFLLWSLLGLIGGSIISFLGYMICLEWSGWDINIININFSTLFSSDVATFWAYSITFALKTAFTMVWNFVTRKLFIYKAPKEETK
ncbi:MAG: hypothetical protein Q4F15_01155 [Bacillota bacterium]|nr:hypothetical protein [Bacillota bacterium]